jgi:excisionase family DNA binding protein
MKPNFLNAHQLAEHLEVRYDTILEWAREGKIPFIKDHRGHYLFHLNRVFDALLSQQPATSNGRSKTD